MSEWKTYKLCEVADLSTGFPFNGHKYAKEGQRVVRGDNVTIGELRWDTDKDKRWNEPFVRAEEFSLREGDIVIGMDGSRVGRNRAQIKAEDLPLLLAQRVACVRHNAKSLQKFLYYQIFSKNFENYIKSVHTGTSIPHVSLKQIGGFSFQVPDLLTQQRIAAILGSLDDKIELNRRINANLEEQAQALFKSWFVDFEPFRDGPFVDSELGKIPQGWKEGNYTDIVEIRGGGTPKTDMQEYWNGNIPFFSPKDVGAGCFILDTEKYITAKGLENCNSSLFQPNTVFITARGTVGKVVMSGTEMAMNQTNYALLGKQNIPQYYVYHITLQLVGRLLKKANGAVFNAITTRDFACEQIVIPPYSTIKHFSDIVKPIYENILLNEVQSNRLSALRDTLLPKLMSSELSVESDYEL